MRKNNTHRILSFVMAIVMVLSLSPVSVYAAEEEHIHEDTTEVPVIVEQQDDVQDIIEEEATIEATIEATEPTEPVDEGSVPAGNLQASEISEAVYQSIAAAEDVLYRYWNPAEIPAEGIDAFVNAMDVDTFISALIDFEDTTYVIQDLLGNVEISDDEWTVLGEATADFDHFWIALTNRAMAEELYGTYAANGTVDGLYLSYVANAGSADITLGTSAFTFSAKSPSALKATAGKSTFTIQNTTGYKATISFDYALSGTYTSYTINGKNETTGSYEITLADQASFTVVMNIPGKNLFQTNTGKFAVTNLTVKQVLDSAQLTIDYDSSLGSMKDASGKVISPNSPYTVGTSGVKVTPVPNSGCSFVAWVDPDTGAFISQASPREFTATTATISSIKKMPPMVTPFAVFCIVALTVSKGTVTVRTQPLLGRWMYRP